MTAKRQKHSGAFKAKVAIEALQERETLSELAKKYEMHPNQIARWKKEFLERAPQLFEKPVSEKKDDTDLDKLYVKIGQLEMEREFLKKKLKETGPVTNRLQMVDRQEGLSIRCQCNLVSVNRGSFYYQPIGETEENLRVMRLMDEHYLERPTEGVKRVRDFLLALGIIANHKRVRRLLRLMGLMAIYPKKNLSKLGQAKYIRPYLLKGLTIDHSNHVWAIDITYIPMPKGFLYLTAIIDVYSRFVVGWGISNSLDASYSLNVTKEAILRYGKPEIINSDQGSQFTCNDWIEYLEKEDIKISMDGKGRCIDNIFIERFWRSVKYDYVYIKVPSDGLELYQGLKEYMDYYNNELCHQGIDHQIPANRYYKAA